MLKSHFQIRFFTIFLQIIKQPVYQLFQFPDHTGNGILLCLLKLNASAIEITMGLEQNR